MARCRTDRLHQSGWFLTPLASIFLRQKISPRNRPTIPFLKKKGGGASPSLQTLQIVLDFTMDFIFCTNHPTETIIFETV